MISMIKDSESYASEIEAIFADEALVSAMRMREPKLSDKSEPVSSEIFERRCAEAVAALCSRKSERP